MKKFLLNSATIFFSILMTLCVADFAVYAWYKLNATSDADRLQTMESKKLMLRPETEELLSSSRLLEKNKKILFLGDSFTYGDLIDYKDTFPLQIQQRLKTQKSSPISINAGFGGNNMVDSYNVLNRMLKRVTPDLVVLTVLANDYFFDPWNLHPYDVCPNLQYKKNSLEYKLMKNSHLFHYFYHRRKFIPAPSGNEVGEFTPFQTCASYYFSEILKTLNSKNIEYIVAYHRGALKKRRMCARFSKILPNIVHHFERLYGVTPVLLTDSIVSSNCEWSESFYTYDDYHLNASGYTQFAEKLLPLIKKKLNLD